MKEYAGVEKERKELIRERIRGKTARAKRRREREQEKAAHRKKRKKLNKLDKYIVFSFSMVIIFTAAEIVTGQENSALTVSFFSVFGGEVLLCALIKSLNLKNEKEEREDKENG